MCRDDLDFFRDGLERLTPYIPGKPVEEVRRELGLTGRIVRLTGLPRPAPLSP